MYQTSTILTVPSDSQTTIEQSVQQLDLAGLLVVRSFDLKVARAAHVNCRCPHHGTDQCDCQLVVLLVYGQDKTPVTLVVHGHDGQTQISLVEAPEQPPAQDLVNSIVQAIQTRDGQVPKVSNYTG